MAQEVPPQQAVNRFNEIIIDAEMERLLVSVLASHDELVDALSELREFHQSPEAGMDLKLLLTKAEEALQNALRIRQAD